MGKREKYIINCETKTQLQWIICTERTHTRKGGDKRENISPSDKG